MLYYRYTTTTAQQHVLQGAHTIKTFLTSFFILLGCIATAADKPPIIVDFELKTDWRGEIIALPPGFAPDVTIKGVEEIRFAPGMFKPDQPDFFSYVLVINSTTGQRFDTNFLHQELLAYYKGLAKSVSKEAIDSSKFSLTLKELKIPQAAGEASYAGALDWIEPFATRKTQVLNFEIQLTARGGKQYLLVGASPQKSDHAIWKDLRKVLATFTLKQKPTSK